MTPLPSAELCILLLSPFKALLQQNNALTIHNTPKAHQQRAWLKAPHNTFGFMQKQCQINLPTHVDEWHTFDHSHLTSQHASSAQLWRCPYFLTNKTSTNAGTLKYMGTFSEHTIHWATSLSLDHAGTQSCPLRQTSHTYTPSSRVALVVDQPTRQRPSSVTVAS